MTLRISYINYIDDALITAANQVASLPAFNLKDQDVQKIWRSTTNADQSILADLGALYTIGVVGLINTNFASGQTLQIRVSTADATGVAGDAYNVSGIATNPDGAYHNNFHHYIEPAVVGRYIRIDFINNTDPPEAGRWVAGPAWAPSRHIAFGWQPLWRDASRRTLSLGQNVYTEVRPRQRGYRFSLRGLTTSEIQNELFELNRICGIGRDILVCIDKDSDNPGRDAIWGLQEEPAEPTQVDREVWEARFSVWERL